MLRITQEQAKEFQEDPINRFFLFVCSFEQEDSFVFGATTNGMELEREREISFRIVFFFIFYLN